jgi:hypothetical protein
MGLVTDLSAAFVAFTIEVDDAAEARMEHRTTGGGGRGAWLVSLAMWRNCLQWLPDEGISVAELLDVARTPSNFGGMRRWGYIEVEGWPRAAKGRPRPDAVVRPTKRGAGAREIWDGKPAEIERRRAARFGAGAVELRKALVELAGGLDPRLPDTMPIVHHGWGTRRDDAGNGSARRSDTVPEADLARGPGPIAVADSASTRCWPGRSQPSPWSSRRAASSRWRCTRTCSRCSGRIRPHCATFPISPASPASSSTTRWGSSDGRGWPRSSLPRGRSEGNRWC